jgi:hypothetical protein
MAMTMRFSCLAGQSLDLGLSEFSEPAGFQTFKDHNAYSHPVDAFDGDVAALKDFADFTVLSFGQNQPDGMGSREAP